MCDFWPLLYHSVGKMGEGMEEKMGEWKGWGGGEDHLIQRAVVSFNCLALYVVAIIITFTTEKVNSDLEALL